MRRSAKTAPAVPGIASSPTPVQTALEFCSIYEPSAHTLDALNTAAAALSDPNARATELLGLVLSSPEMALA